MPMDGQSEYRDKLQRIEQSILAKEPKLQPIVERLPVYDGSYRTIQRDYVPHRVENVSRRGGRCRVTGEQKSMMLESTISRFEQREQLNLSIN